MEKWIKCKDTIQDNSGSQKGVAISLALPHIAYPSIIMRSVSISLPLMSQVSNANIQFISPRQSARMHVRVPGKIVEEETGWKE